MTRSRTGWLVSLVIIAAGALSGCSAEGGQTDERAVPPPATAESPAGVDTSPPDETVGRSILVASTRGSSASCLSHTTASSLVAMYDPIAQAEGDVTITGVRAVGRKVRLVATEGVIVTSEPAFGPGILTDDRWPIDDKWLRGKTDLSTRQALRGMTLADGQRLLPLFAVRGGPGSTLDGLVLTYVDAGDNSGRVTLPIGTRFDGGTCRL
jgi:hypothetical protein